MADQLRAPHSPKRPQRGQEINGFKNVRLALRVVAQQEVKPGREVGIQPRVIAEVPETKMGQMHAARLAERAAAAEENSWRLQNMLAVAGSLLLPFRMSNSGQLHAIHKVGTAPGREY